MIKHIVQLHDVLYEYLKSRDALLIRFRNILKIFFELYYLDKCTSLLSYLDSFLFEYFLLIDFFWIFIELFESQQINKKLA